MAVQKQKMTIMVMMTMKKKSSTVTSEEQTQIAIELGDTLWAVTISFSHFLYILRVHMYTHTYINTHTHTQSTHTHPHTTHTYTQQSLSTLTDVVIAGALPQCLRPINHPNHHICAQIIGQCMWRLCEQPSLGVLYRSGSKFRGVRLLLQALSHPTGSKCLLGSLLLLQKYLISFILFNHACLTVHCATFTLSLFRETISAR